MFYWIWSALILATLLAAAGWAWNMWGKGKKLFSAVNRAGDMVERLTERTEELMDLAEQESENNPLRPYSVAQSRQLRKDHKHLKKLRRKLRLARSAQHWNAIWGDGPVGELVPGRNGGGGAGGLAMGSQVARRAGEFAAGQNGDRRAEQQG